MRSILTSILSIIIGTIECGQSIVLTWTKMVVLSRDESIHPQVMVWLDACSKGITALVIFNEGTVDHAVHIEKVLLVALKYENQVLDSDWIFQQDGAMLHSHYLTQQWYRDNFLTFINNENWPPNSSDLNPLDYSI